MWLEKTIAVQVRHARCETLVVAVTAKNSFSDLRTRSDSRLGITSQQRLLVASSLLDVRAALRGLSVNPAIRLGRIIRNELNGDG